MGRHITYDSSNDRLVFLIPRIWWRLIDKLITPFHQHARYSYSVKIGNR